MSNNTEVLKKENLVWLVIALMVIGLISGIIIYTTDKKSQKNNKIFIIKKEHEQYK